MPECGSHTDAQGHALSLLGNRSVQTPGTSARSLCTSIAVAFFVLSFPLLASAYTSPGKPDGFVNDFANVIPEDEQAALEARLNGLEESTGNEVVVATIESLGDETVETYAEKLFQEWGIGKERADNGLLILVSTGDREARIEVGYGLEGTVTDIQSGNIIRKVMIPSFRDGDYPGGIVAGASAIVEIITGSPDAEQYSIPEEQSSPAIDFDWAALFFFAIVLLNGAARILGKTKSWWLGGLLGSIAGAIIGLIWGFVPIGLIAIALLSIAGLIFDFIVSRHPPGSGKGGKGGIGGLWPLLFMGNNSNKGGSGFGGGFGGFGGGSSGGGGASGKW